MIKAKNSSFTYSVGVCLCGTLKAVVLLSYGEQRVVTLKDLYYNFLKIDAKLYFTISKNVPHISGIKAPLDYQFVKGVRTLVLLWLPMMVDQIN